MYFLKAIHPNQIFLKKFDTKSQDLQKKIEVEEHEMYTNKWTNNKATTLHKTNPAHCKKNNEIIGKMKEKKTVQESKA